MKIFTGFLLSVVLLGCKVSSKTDLASKQWNEAGFDIGTNVKAGIPAYEAGNIEYKRDGKLVLTVRLGDPAIIDVAAKPERWGFFQFPTIYRSLDNAVVAKWNMSDDEMESYGKENHSFSLSKDTGKSWSVVGKEPVAGDGLILPDGERIAIYTPPALKVEDIQLPKSVGASLATGSSKAGEFTFYKLDQLPFELQGVYINRLNKGEANWTHEHAVLNDSQAVRYSLRGQFPIVWWGDMRIASDNAIIAGIYPGFLLGKVGHTDPSGVFFYRSTDNGRTWEIQGRIPYIPDLKADPNGDKNHVLGFTEPAFEILSDGSFLCVMRTGNLNPMYFSRSTDMGVTWSKPESFTQAGVLPRLLQLENGIIVLTSGRPGVQMRFCIDGKGEKWTDPFEMLPFDNEKVTVSCGYTGLLATGPDRFLLIYSDFKYQNKEKEIRKAIKVRQIIVKPK
ncbi:MAG TPA: hypothetical protein DIW47_14510 [Bacteroidetes bacterium]|nr:hypothetical protein [Bacteroidota bacterium]